MLAIITPLYILFLIGYGLYSIYAIHHLNEYGYSGVASQRVLRVYIGCAGLIILITFGFILYFFIR